jgi:hypothetical protein
MAERRQRGKPRALDGRVQLGVAVSQETYRDLTDLLQQRGYIMRSFVERAIQAEIQRERERIGAK